MPQDEDFDTDVRQIIARELREMAEAKPPKYTRFTYVSFWVKDIWRMAAELLERKVSL